jgi:hypothetical protein
VLRYQVTMKLSSKCSKDTIFRFGSIHGLPRLVRVKVLDAVSRLLDRLL